MESRNTVSFLLLFCLLIGFFACTPQSPIDDPAVTTDSVIVVEYCPSMGQFVNVLPRYEAGDTYETMCRKAQESLRRGSAVTLGGFGGYVTMSMGKPIINLPNSRDFYIAGNAFMANGSDSTGNSEPGVVWVSIDENQNGKPDDKWYELAGSEYFKPETQHNYKRTWHKSDTTLNNKFHLQPYFPQWLTDTAIIVTGTLLASHKVEEGGVIAQRVLEYGYVDNLPNTDTIGCSFDLDWAVDNNGNPVSLQQCDFVRVVTAVDEVYPMIGELSTEVSGMQLLDETKQY